MFFMEAPNDRDYNASGSESSKKGNDATKFKTLSGEMRKLFESYEFDTEEYKAKINALKAQLTE